MPRPMPPMTPYPRYSTQSWLVAMPSAPTRNPVDQNTAETSIALRGPFRSTQVPPTAADSPSMTMAMLKMMPIAVWLVSKCATSEFL